MSQKSNKKFFTRREFIKGFGGGAMGAAVVTRLLPQEAASLKIQTDNVPLWEKKTILLTINERQIAVTVEPRETLLYVIREKLNLTGSKKICDRGECGGCTVLLDGDPVYACLYLAVRAEGKTITTIEGLAKDGQLHPVQRAFIDEDGHQCGFCTPGFILSSVALLQGTGDAGLEEIKDGLSGNLCRCGNYDRIYKAVSTAAKEMRRV
jgi:xanthine dehydrogenase YagT iron-sulfur-binding subunit